MAADWQRSIAAVTGRAVVDIAVLSGGSIGQVYRVRLAGGETMVAKVDDGATPRLSLEGYMLQYLARHSRLPVPRVYHSSDRILLMEYIPGESNLSGAVQAHAAELLAELHEISAPAFGLERDTLIGGLPQPNARTPRWLDFFRQQRLLYMAGLARQSGRLSPDLFKRLQEFAAHLDDWLEEPQRPSLIHGDVWTTNILARSGRVAAFVDPAIYYAHAEIELAFSTLFGTFGEAFFRRYAEIRPIAPGFFQTRRDIYNLYPLLVHVRLFGGSYEQSVANILRRFGY